MSECSGSLFYPNPVKKWRAQQRKNAVSLAYPPFAQHRTVLIPGTNRPPSRPPVEEASEPLRCFCDRTAPRRPPPTTSRISSNFHFASAAVAAAVFKLSSNCKPVRFLLRYTAASLPRSPSLPRFPSSFPPCPSVLTPQVASTQRAKVRHSDNVSLLKEIPLEKQL